jgi:hypothetical protein
VGCFGTEFFDGIKHGFLGIEGIATSIKIQSPVAILWPGMGRNMGLGDDDNSADSVRWKPVDGNRPDLGSGDLGDLDENLLYLFHTADNLGITARGFDDIMAA